MKKHCAAIILAAGKGSRMGMKEAKQFLEIGGLPVVAHSLTAFQKSPRIDEIILAVPKEQIAYVRREIVEKYGFDKVTAVTAGGAQRYESVWNALQILSERAEEGYVFIHDGARPFVNEDIINRAYECVYPQIRHPAYRNSRTHHRRRVHHPFRRMSSSFPANAPSE